MGNYLTVFVFSVIFGVAATGWRAFNPSASKQYRTPAWKYGLLVFVLVFIIANVIYFSSNKKDKYQYRDEEKRNKNYKNFVRLS